jgi:hypothetical protein
VIAATYAAPVSAETDVGVGLSPLVGTHDEGGGPQWVPPVPIPIAEIRQRIGHAEVFFETLPIAVPIAHGAGSGISSTTDLAFFDAAFRLYDPGNHIYLGLGEIVYNQKTAYSIGQVNSSRVSGGRYELGALLMKKRQLRVELDYMPHISGTVEQKLSLTPGSVLDLSAPETGGQLEGNLEYSVSHGATELRYGLRYLNYVMAFPGGGIADHNAGVLPSVTFLWHFGS